MKKVIVSGMVGNALEWYDYALYGHFAGIISRLFFPSENQYTSLLAAFGVFAAGFLMRPVGAILFGYIGDSYGRRTALTSSIILMAVSTGLVCILPTYAEIGIAAPILLTIIRLMQGLSLGGEFSGSMVFVTEHSKGKNRSIAASSSFFSACIGILMGSFVGTAFSQVMPLEDFENWGWRLPFVLGVFIGIVGLYIRYNLPESPEYREAKESGALTYEPLGRAFRKHIPQLLMGIGIYLTVTVPFYTLSVFINTFMSKILNYDISKALFINTISMLVLTFLIPVSAILSDKVGRKPILVTSCLGILVTAYPCFMLLSYEGFIYPLLGQIIFAICIGFFFGPIPTVLVDLFPTRVRYTGMALSYNFAAAFFGGTTPIIAIWLIEKTAINNAPAFYVIACAIITLISLYFYKDSNNKR